MVVDVAAGEAAVLARGHAVGKDEQRLAIGSDELGIAGCERAARRPDPEDVFAAIPARAVLTWLHRSPPATACRLLALPPVVLGLARARFGAGERRGTEREEVVEAAKEPLD